MNVAIIPARGGSKRVVDKNIRVFAGRPMISYPIRAALEAGCFERVIVTTDSERIAEVALQFGAEVPFRRPSELSTDFVSLMPVLRHAIEQLSIAHGMDALGTVFCIYATSALLLPDDLLRAMSQLEKEPEADFVLAITEYGYPPQRSLTLEPSGFVRFSDAQFASVQSQQLQPLYHDAGMFFGGKAKALMEYETALHGRCLVQKISRTRSQDIDTEEDWLIAEAIYQSLNKDHIS